jgi:HSP20 family protein
VYAQVLPFADAQGEQDWPSGFAGIPAMQQLRRTTIMTSLTSWNPLKQAVRFDPISNIDEMFRNLAARPAWRNLDIAPTIPVDVAENGKSYTVTADIPGVNKDDIQISVEGNQVSISAEVKRESTHNESETDVLVERYYGKTYRSFTLPSELDANKAKAQYKDGVLTLKLPKKANGSSHKIAVS